MPAKLLQGVVERGAGILLVAFAISALATTPAAAGLTVCKVLSFDVALQGVTLPPKSSPNLLTPAACRTLPFYTAGPNEIAVIHATSTGSPSSISSSNINMAITRSTPLNPFVAINVFSQSESMADGTAAVKSEARTPLTEGTSYQFGTGFSVDETETAMSVLACQATVVIYRVDP